MALTVNSKVGQPAGCSAGAEAGVALSGIVQLTCQHFQRTVNSANRRQLYSGSTTPYRGTPVGGGVLYHLSVAAGCGNMLYTISTQLQCTVFSLQSDWLTGHCVLSHSAGRTLASPQQLCRFCPLPLSSISQSPTSRPTWPARAQLRLHHASIRSI